MESRDTAHNGGRWESEGDVEWNYVYNPETEKLTEYEPEEDYTALLILVAVVIILSSGFVYYISIKNKARKQTKKKTGKK